LHVRLKLKKIYIFLTAYINKKSTPSNLDSSQAKKCFKIIVGLYEEAAHGWVWIYSANIIISPIVYGLIILPRQRLRMNE